MADFDISVAIRIFSAPSRRLGQAIGAAISLARLADRDSIR
jgi:hypothetical protein